jgi:phosphoribosylamine--glycine ligase
MKILIIGGGGREHALAWKVAQNDRVTDVYVAPGNGGTQSEKKLVNIPLDPLNFEGLATFAEKTNIDLTLIGPEAPLVNGIVDFFQSRNLPCFGPSMAASQLEGSKAFSKDFLKRHKIPSAEYEVFTDPDQAKAFISQVGTPIVVKADGLAAGKGVVVAQTERDAIAAIDDMLTDEKYGQAGRRIVIESFLEGEEASFIAMVDGKNILPMATSQDHKTRDAGDKGPNTGGMGAYSPAPVLDEKMSNRVMSEILIPTVRGMASDGIPYTGFLYAGLMIGSKGSINVIEFNCRFGDPEAQPVMLRLESDLIEHCMAAIEGKLDQQTAKWDPRPAVGVVMAANGYPAEYATGDKITGLDEISNPEVKIFHAGTEIVDAGETVTSGGRVLCTVALGSSISEATKNAYSAIKNITWNGAFYRNDIAYRAIAREHETLSE